MRAPVAADAGDDGVTPLSQEHLDLVGRCHPVTLSGPSPPGGALHRPAALAEVPEALACCPKPGCAVLRSKYGLAVWAGLGGLAWPRRMPGCRDHRQLIALGA
jgi:hypothetical protein